MSDFANLFTYLLSYILSLFIYFYFNYNLCVLNQALEICVYLYFGNILISAAWFQRFQPVMIMQLPDIWPIVVVGSHVHEYLTAKSGHVSEVLLTGWQNIPRVGVQRAVNLPVAPLVLSNASFFSSIHSILTVPTGQSLASSVAFICSMSDLSQEEINFALQYPNSF